MNTQLEQGALNTIAWILVFAGVCAFVASAIGLVLVAAAASRQSPAALRQELDDAYYVIIHTKQAIWPFIISLFLSAVIAIGGYVQTDRFVNQRIQRALEMQPEFKAKAEG